MAEKMSYEIETEWYDRDDGRVCVAKAIAKDGKVLEAMHFRVSSNVTDLREFYERLAELPDEIIVEFVRGELKFRLENPGLFG